MELPYFNHPTQVCFLDTNDCGEKTYCQGIAYRDEVICGCCGTAFSIEELYERAETDENVIVPYESWVDLSAEILGS